MASNQVVQNHSQPRTLKTNYSLRTYKTRRCPKIKIKLTLLCSMSSMTTLSTLKFSLKPQFLNLGKTAIPN